MTRHRLDYELVSRGLVADLESARQAIDSRQVTLDGAPGLKAGTLVPASAHIRLEHARGFVSRGGEKLAGALNDFRLEVAGWHCLDAGAGSGGFTDCLLKAGAASVVAVDVGYGQFDWKLRRDPRVQLLERTNLRSLPAHRWDLDLVVADLSFVSLTSLSAKIAELAGDRARCVLLVKPQFEAPRAQVGPGGVVRDPAVWRAAIASVVEALAKEGLGTVAVAPSRLSGPAGNREFFVHAVAGAGPNEPTGIAGMPSG